MSINFESSVLEANFNFLELLWTNSVKNADNCLQKFWKILHNTREFEIGQTTWLQLGTFIGYGNIDHFLKQNMWATKKQRIVRRIKVVF